jgi:hypothetical protein
MSPNNPSSSNEGSKECIYYYVEQRSLRTASITTVIQLFVVTPFPPAHRTPKADQHYFVLVSASVCTPDMVATIRDSVKRKKLTGYRHAGTKGERYSFYSEVSFTPRPCLPREWIPSTHCAGDWVGLSAGMDTEIKSKAVPRHAT